MKRDLRLTVIDPRSEEGMAWLRQEHERWLAESSSEELRAAIAKLEDDLRRCREYEREKPQYTAGWRAYADMTIRGLAELEAVLAARADALDVVALDAPQPPVVFDEPMMARTAALFDFLSVLLPPRIVREDLGDAMERVESLILEGAPAWKVWLALLSMTFWSLLSALRRR